MNFASLVRDTLEELNDMNKICLSASLIWVGGLVLFTDSLSEDNF